MSRQPTTTITYANLIQDKESSMLPRPCNLPILPTLLQARFTDTSH